MEVVCVHDFQQGASQQFYDLTEKFLLKEAGIESIDDWLACCIFLEELGETRQPLILSGCSDS